jgi:hypothetical protein
MNQHMSEKIHRISYEAACGRDQYRYWFDDKYIYREWSKGPDFSKDFFPLDDLSEEYAQAASRPKSVSEGIRNAVSYIMGAVVVFFSEFNAQIPLLAPVLLLLGISRFSSNYPWLFPKKWTVVRYHGGGDAFYILHGDRDDKERTEFENALAEAIRGR